MNINLDGPPANDPDRTRCGWWRDGNRITVRSDASETTFTLPRGQRRVSLYRLGDGRAQLAIGGFTKTTVVVTGPSDHIRKLKEAVLS